MEAFSKDILLCLSDNVFSGYSKLFSRMKFINDFLIEPRREASVEIVLERRPEESFRV
jgi:hypothetical protein